MLKKRGEWRGVEEERVLRKRGELRGVEEVCTECWPLSDVQVLARWEEFQSKVKAYRDKVSALLPLLADSVCVFVCVFVCIQSRN